MIKWLARMALLWIVPLGWGCSDGKAPAGPPEAEPGVLTLALETPHTDDAALLLSLSGPGPITEVGAPGGTAYLIHARGTSTSVKIAVFGEVGSGAVLRFAVPDVNRAASYEVRLLEVADRENELRAATGGYTLQVVR